jgi:hypothetical protein
MELAVERIKFFFKLPTIDVQLAGQTEKVK